MGTVQTDSTGTYPMENRNHIIMSKETCEIKGMSLFHQPGSGSHIFSNEKSTMTGEFIENMFHVWDPQSKSKPAEHLDD